MMVYEITVKLIRHDRAYRSITTRRKPPDGVSMIALLMQTLADMKPAIELGLGDDAAEIEVHCRPVRVEASVEPVQ